MSSNGAKSYDDICVLCFLMQFDFDLSKVSDISRNLSKRGYAPSEFRHILPLSGPGICEQIEKAAKEYKNVVVWCGDEYIGEDVEQTASEDLSLSLTDGACEFNGSTLYFGYPGSKVTDEKICAALDKKYGNDFDVLYFKMVDAPHNLVNDAAKKVHGVCPNAEIHFDERYGDALFSVIYPMGGDEKLDGRLSFAVLGGLDDYVYAMEDVSLAARLVELLKLRKMKISVSESFTGGGVGRRIVQIPGASEVFFESLNTYDNRSKTMRLGVKEETLRRYGAVSEQVAHEMALGLLKSGKCDIAVSTTGIAGPKSDDTNKPVGLCYIGVGTADFIDVFQLNLCGSRREITETAVNIALFRAIKAIK